MVAVQEASVAVIGLGAQGLVTAKNLLEQGFRVTGFERQDYLGGMWHYSAQHHVSALLSTVVNVSRERACFTDFAFPPGTDSYPSAAHIDQYLNNYADAFSLRPHLRLSTNVQSIERNDVNNCWRLTIQSGNTSQPEILTFDKIAMANGPHNKAILPDLPSRHLFGGEILHFKEFKEPEAFTNKRVLVVGASNSAADTATSLVGTASKICLSHRHSALILTRSLKNGNSPDHELTYRKLEMKDTMDRLAPSLSVKFLDNVVKGIQREHPANSTRHGVWVLHRQRSIRTQQSLTL
jgi:dimethylaniline monooxygenase (N-oxide forming)